MPEIDPRLALVERFFRGTGATYDIVVNVATFGIDRLWKRRIVSLIPPDAGRILDLACGTGISTLAIARRFPRSRIVGVELREEYLALARDKVRRQKLQNVELVLSRAEDYRSDEPFDCIASSYLAKYADLPPLVRNCRGMLKDGGVLLMHDFTFPPSRALVALWRLYFKMLQTIGGALLPGWREIYYGLPRLIEETRWLPELQHALAENGFRGVRTQYLTAYGSAIVSARR
jgi:demethylmenaquinone methyltransferase / 2-methoxy-6-polyprenyl-1,4-benzoquinol methylase